MRTKTILFGFMMFLLLMSGFGCENTSKNNLSSDKTAPNTVIQGVMRFDDPHGPQIDEILLDHDYTNAHKDDLQKLDGKEVGAKGTLITHYCLPEEQCLTSGYIKHLEDIEYIKALDK